MILLSRTVSRLLIAGLLGISFFVAARPCAAVGLRIPAIDAYQIDEAALSFHAMELNFDGGAQCSNLEIVTQLFRFTAPETYRSALSIVDQVKLAISQVQHRQKMHQDWMRTKLGLVVKKSRSGFKWLVATWPRQRLVDAEDPDLVADDRLPIAVRESAESAYWSYYRDCEHWNVELTQFPQQLHPSNVSKRKVANDAQTEKLVLSPAVENQKAQNQKFQAMFGVLNRTSEWLGQTLRSIEFAAIESPVLSRGVILKQ